eukprot:gnl/TRDRNA2_/TRDRNA2_154167_c0_seq1.p1 gnl/TRDRNA2_/TRDRNA2_154167_c0~~gnl/TRDRNA2_/TRDRNA2_154167_c0_seq1.p1  ORF type:complete len:450 (-),score=97.87 gnl/TRDRNA2_/TRDRNA2_154167_c0_seq1:60-1217(-)
MPRAGLTAVGRAAMPRAGLTAVGRAAMPRAGLTAVGRAAMPRAGLTAVGRAAMPRAGLTAVGRAAMPRGVDLNLDEFDLSTTADVTSTVKSSDDCLPMGAAFWSDVFGQSSSVFKEDDKALLKKIFDAKVCDRYDEGDRFVPPDSGFEYVQKLRSLTREEDAMRQRRMDFFFSEKFVMTEPGPLYPSSWKSAFEITDGRKVPQVHFRPDYTAEASAFEQILKTATPEFEKSSEDGIKFRIYKFGSLEVRTTTKPDEKEIIGAVFSTSAPSTAGHQCQQVNGNEVVAKATEYVEKARNVKGHHSYVVLETEHGNMIVSEVLQDGRVAWESNPKDLEDRNSLAKVLRSADCSGWSVQISAIQDGSVTWTQLCTAAKKMVRDQKVLLD